MATARVLEVHQQQQCPLDNACCLPVSDLLQKALVVALRELYCGSGAAGCSRGRAGDTWAAVP